MFKGKGWFIESNAGGTTKINPQKWRPRQPETTRHGSNQREDAKSKWSLISTWWLTVSPSARRRDVGVWGTQVVGLSIFCYHHHHQSQCLLFAISFRAICRCSCSTAEIGYGPWNCCLDCCAGHVQSCLRVGIDNGTMVPHKHFPIVCLIAQSILLYYLWNRPRHDPVQ